MKNTFNLKKTLVILGLTNMLAKQLVRKYFSAVTYGYKWF